MKVWFEENRAKAGPVTEKDIPDLIKAGRIKDDTLVWHRYLDDWTPFSQCKSVLLPNASTKAPFKKA